MDNETRDAIGRALYEATADFTDSRTPAWDSLLNKEMWIVRARAVLSAYLARQLELLSEENN